MNALTLIRLTVPFVGTVGAVSGSVAAPTSRNATVLRFAPDTHNKPKPSSSG